MKLLFRLGQAVSCNPEGRGFDSRWCIYIFRLHNPSGRTMALALHSASNRNEYQEYFLEGKGGRCVGLATLPPSFADCFEM